MLQPGDCILFSGKSLISRGIRWFTDSKWNHAAIYVGGGGQFVIEATAAGVEKTALKELLKCEAVCVRRIPDLKVEDAELMKDRAYGLIYDNYDYAQIASLGIYFLFRKIGIKIPWLVRNAKSEMICSELFAVCALVIPVRFERETKLVTPDSLYQTDKMNTMFEGSCENLEGLDGII